MIGRTVVEIYTTTFGRRFIATRCSMVPIIGSARRIVAQKGFKTTVRGCAVLFDESYVPFSRCVCSVTVVFEQLREHDERWVDTMVAVVTHIIKPHVVGIPTGHRGRSGRCAHTKRVVVSQSNTLGDQSVDLGCDGGVVVCKAKVVVSQVVGHYLNYMWRLSCIENGQEGARNEKMKRQH